jgi:hypothetical protein
LGRTARRNDAGEIQRESIKNKPRRFKEKKNGDKGSGQCRRSFGRQVIYVNLQLLHKQMVSKFNWALTYQYNELNSTLSGFKSPRKCSSPGILPQAKGLLVVPEEPHWAQHTSNAPASKK